MRRKKEINFFLIIYIITGYAFLKHPTYAEHSSNILLLFDILIVLILVAKWGKLPKDSSPFKLVVPLLFFVPYLSGISKVIYSGGFFFSISIIVTSIGFLWYYLLYLRHITEQTIINSLFLIGVVIFLIQVFQQLFPQYAMFGIYTEEQAMRHNYELAEERNGLIRFSLGGANVILICMYYTWSQIMSRFSVKKMLVFLMFFASAYLFLTRQLLFSSIVTLLVSFIIVRTKGNAWIYIVALAFIAAIGLNFQSLFGELAASAQEEWSTDNIRYSSIMYFGEKIFATPVTMLFGNGLAAMTEELKNMGFDPTDIGFVGQAFYYGFIWIVLWIYTVYLILFKYKSRVPMYIRLFVIATTIHSLGMFPYRNNGEIAIWAVILYISSLYMGNNIDFNGGTKIIKRG